MDNIFEQLVGSSKIPDLVTVEQTFPRPVIKDIPAAVRKALNEKKLIQRIPEGARVAVSAGSRGIANISLITATVVKLLQEAGAEPFIVPAMGSHGGATAEGQKAVLKSLCITEEQLGVPIRSSMEVEQVGTTATKLPLYIDKLACREADAIVVINRIKPHTTFRGDYESGLAKMIVIGLGKQQGAELCHSTGPQNMAAMIKELAEHLIEKTSIVFGLGLVENAYDETCQITALPAEEIIDKEPDLLKEARSQMPCIYFKNYDVLVIDEMGKNISGTGLDPNIVGRYTTETMKNENWVQRIVVLDLTAPTQGNANGIGLADICSKKAYQKINFEKTYPNSLTTGVVFSTKIPMVMNNDRQAIQAAIKTCFDSDKNKIRLVRIKNTLQLENIQISEALLPEARKNPMIKVLNDQTRPLSFDEEGNLIL